MRNLFALLALIGLAGIVLGALTIVRAAAGPSGPLATSLYLRAFWQGRD